MAQLREGEFELDGYRFGTPDNDAVILSGGFDPGAPETRHADAENPVGDGGYFGRDYLTGPTWSFHLGVRHDADVYTTLAELAEVWRNPSVRTTPGATSTLRFCRNGVTYRVYGRPRHFGVRPSEVADPEFAEVEADFKVEAPYMYLDEERVIQVNLMAPTSDGGLVLPAELPWELARPTNTGNSLVYVDTVTPAPFVVEVLGPVVGAVSNIRVSGPGWQIGVNTDVAYDQTLRVDTRTMTATRNGVSVAGSLTRQTRLNARLRPGASQISFTANDPSNTASLRLSWRPTYPIL